MTIQDQNGKQIYQEEIDTFAENRIEGAELMQKEFPEGSYTIQFERIGKSPNGSPDKRGWVEVGALKIRTEKKETVDRSRLEDELTICAALNEDKYTKESWKKLQSVINDAEDLLKKKDEETCTSEMNDKADEVNAARNNLQEIKVDISELNNALKAAKAISEEGYTEESFGALKQSISEAEALLDGTYTQKEVDEKTAVLLQRIKELRADKTLLQEKYNEIKDMTQGNVTDASWNDFTKLRDLANDILTDPTATPKKVSDVLSDLEAFEFTYKDDPDEGGDKDPQEPQNPQDPQEPQDPQNPQGSQGSQNPQDPQNSTSGNQGNTNASHTGASVKTGDSAPVLIPLAAMCGIIGLLYVMRKKRKL